MKGFRNVYFFLFALALIWSSSVITLQAQTTSFTYQGRLNDGGVPATGVYDLQFKLFDAVSAGVQQGGTVLRDDVQVTGGTFSTILDFGSSVFPGANRWLEVAVRPGASTGAYTVLSPLQPITSTPYAVKSLSAASADGLSVGCVNCVTSVQIAPGTIVDANVSVSAAINPTKIAGTAATLGAANNFTAPQSISTASGFVVPNFGGVVAALASEWSGSSGVGVGVAGFVSNTTIEGAGVAGIAQSPNALGGYFLNSVSGPILIAATGDDHDVLSVFGNANNGTGKVGIGTEDALATLTVRGSATAPLTGTVTVSSGSSVVTGTGTKFGFEVGIGDRITNTANNETRIVGGISSDTSLFTTSNWTTSASGTFSDTAAIFRIDDFTNTSRLVMDAAGNLGVGTLAPRTTLDVGGRSTFRNRVVVSNNGNNQKPSLLTVRAATFTSIIGTASVTSGSAVVTGTGTSFLDNIGLGDRITLGAPSSETRTVTALTDGTHLTVDSNFTITAGGVTVTPIASLFRTDDIGGTPQFLINDSGNVGIGSGAALVPTDRLQVFGDIRVGTSGTNGCVRAFDGSMIGGSCSSDERLKMNIQSFEPVMGRLMQLRPVSYYWRADEHPEYHFGSERTSGLVAQEVEKVLPEMVTTDDRGYKAVNYSQLPLMLLQAVKELKEESDHRESELLETVKQQQAQIQQLLSVVHELQGHVEGGLESVR